MTRTREQAEQIKEEIDKVKKLISSRIKAFNHQLAFFNSEEVETLTPEGYRLRYEKIKVLEQGVQDYLDQLDPLIEEHEEALFQEKVQEYFRKHLKLAERIEVYLSKANELQKQAQPIQQSSSAIKPSLKTPKIELPEFNGTIEKWIHFRDMFNALVHDNNTLDEIQKFHFLKQSVKIPCGKTNVLDNYEFAAANYEVAWTAVRQRYDDKRKIVRYQLKAFFNVKKMANGSSEELRRLIDTVSAILNSLKQQGFDLNECNEFGNLLVVHTVTELLDEETLKIWKKDVTADFSSWDTMHDFLNALQRSLDDQPFKQTVRATEGRFGKTKSLVSNNQAPARTKCVVCSELHRLHQCQQFHKMTISERFAVVKQNRLCHNCMAPGHQSKDCTNKGRCKTCNQPHNTFIHFDMAPKASPNSSTITATPSSPGTSQISPTANPFNPVNFSRQPQPNAHSVSAVSSNVYATSKQTMLSTVSVYVADKNGQFKLGRALLDTGSDSSFMTNALAKQLGLKTEKSVMTITGIHDKTIVLTHRTNTIIKSRYNVFSRNCQFHLIPDITGNLPAHSIEADLFNIPDEFVPHLADPTFNQSGKIDMLLDNAVFWECLMEQRLCIPNGPTLRCTRFGWIIGGEVSLNLLKSSAFLSCFTNNEQSEEIELDQKLQQFFSSEDVDSTKPVLTPEEQYCEDHFLTTTTRSEDNKYVVRMPIKSNTHDLGTNLSNALHQSYRLDAKRSKDKSYNQLYTNYMSDLIDKGYMSEVQPPTRGQSTHYLPHHGVLKMSSTSTKLRPVFNASSISETGISLNDILCVGPTVQPELVDIIMRFRQHQYIVMADITRMYLQVWIHPEQRNLLRILWRPSLNEPVKHFQLNTVTFGTACAPYLATRTLNQIAVSCEHRFPDASKIMQNAFYVDDLLFSSKSAEEASKMLTHIRYMLQQAGMSLCKIVSNNKRIVQKVPAADQILSDTTSETLKALGIRYDASTDKFSFGLSLMAKESRTKASVLSNIASIFDPMGWLSPVVFTAKLLMKSLWLIPLKWTDTLPPTHQADWDEYRAQFPALNEIAIHRQCIINDSKSVELHGFCDALILGYGAVIYALSINDQRQQKVSIICAKSRVAPKNQKTIARLELCAAVLLTKLATKVVAALSIGIQSVNLWSDSMIALHWITITPSKLQTFVGNRVAVIQELSRSFTWRHVKSEHNPADVISRGLMPNELQNCSIWWDGPAFFKFPMSQWPDTLLKVSAEDPSVKVEMKKSFVVVAPSDLFSYIQTRFSSTRTLYNVFAYIHRFITSTRKNASNKRLNNVKSAPPLSVDEISTAKINIIRLVQREMFTAEYNLLCKQNNNQLIGKQQSSNLSTIFKKSSIRSLAPFVDRNGLLRVGGRLESCPELTFDQKHPIILPHCPFTTVIVREIHRSNLHPGPTSLLSFVRQQFWPVKAKSMIRQIIHDCITCFKDKPRDSQQIMSNLPPARVTLTRPFFNTAVDYAGFYVIRSGTTRNAPHTKCYISLFKCMCTGAIHLELVSDLSANAFIAALDRFSSRRGKPSTIFSDNGTCFHGTDTELRKIIASLDPIVQQFCTEQSIRWQFTTPLAPHAGGIYESGIKSMKHHLKRIMTTVYTFEQFITILCKIEAVLNSRPLTPLSDNPTDLQVLTPGHFLTGGPLISIPQRDFNNKQPNKLKAWEGLQQIQQQFWHSWYHDYLHQLQQRPARFQDVHEFKVGDMILLKDSNLPPMKWLVGRIIKLFPESRTSVVRNVRVITQHGEKDRHIKYLCVLPIENNVESQKPTASSSASQCVPDGI